VICHKIANSCTYSISYKMWCTIRCETEEKLGKI